MTIERDVKLKRRQFIYFNAIEIIEEKLKILVEVLVQRNEIIFLI